jgi:acetolactate synthase-1/2/3 large subunit
VQNADFVLSIGARLDTRAAGSPLTTFAREAKKIIIDIDQNELNKFEKLGMKAEILINADAKNVARAFNNKLVGSKKINIEWWYDKIA